MAPGIVGNSIFFTGKAQGKERLRKQKLLRFIFPFLLACLLSAAPETARCNVLSPWEMPRPSLEKETAVQILNISRNIHTLCAPFKTRKQCKSFEKVEMLQAMGVVFDNAINDGALVNPYGGRIIVKVLEDTFRLFYDGLPREACFQLAAQHWKSKLPYFVGVIINPENELDGNNMFTDDVPPKTAWQACSREKNSVTWQMR